MINRELPENILNEFLKQKMKTDLMEQCTQLRMENASLKKTIEDKNSYIKTITLEHPSTVRITELEDQSERLQIRLNNSQYENEKLKISELTIKKEFIKVVEQLNKFVEVLNEKGFHHHEKETALDDGYDCECCWSLHRS